jgi:hypothetical protein
MIPVYLAFQLAIAVPPHQLSAAGKALSETID